MSDKVREFDEAFADEVNTMKDEDLKSRLVKFEQECQQIEDARKDDQDLARIREELKTANETYTVPLKQHKFRKKLILDVLQGRGKA